MGRITRAGFGVKRSKIGLIAAGFMVSTVAGFFSLTTSYASTVGCTVDNIAPGSSFTSAISGASSGDTICLTSGNFGTWTGTNKNITIKAMPAATPQMRVTLASGDSNFTLDGMTGMSGTVNTGASNIKIQNSTFSSAIDIEGAVTGIVLDGNDFTYAVGPTCGGGNAKIFVGTTGSSAGSALTIKNNDIENGDLDGVHIGGSGILVQNNTFKNLIDWNGACNGSTPGARNSCGSGACTNHTDNIQFESGSNTTLEGNYVYTCQSCSSQGITSFDSETVGVLIENNVVDIPRDWGIEWYSDQGSTIRHNTVVYHPSNYSDFGTGTGKIDINRKSQDPAGSNTHVYDNVATVEFNSGSTGTQDHNTNPSTVTYVSSTHTTHDSYLLTAGSAGHDAASDGTDTGIYAANSGGSGIAADINNDGVVNGADISLLIADFSKTSTAATTPTADVNDDGVINGADLSTVVSNFGH